MGNVIGTVLSYMDFKFNIVEAAKSGTNAAIMKAKSFVRFSLSFSFWLDSNLIGIQTKRYRFEHWLYFLVVTIVHHLRYCSFCFVLLFVNRIDLLLFQFRCIWILSRMLSTSTYRKWSSTYQSTTRFRSPFLFHFRSEFSSWYSLGGDTDRIGVSSARARHAWYRYLILRRRSIAGSFDRMVIFLI